MDLLSTSAAGKKHKKYAQHNVIKLPKNRSNKFLQIPKNNLQPWMCYFQVAVIRGN